MPDQSKEFADLLAQSKKALFQFLKTETELGTTFATVAERYRNQRNTERYQINKENARRALETIERFKGRLLDGQLQEVEPGRAKLENLLSKL